MEKTRAWTNRKFLRLPSCSSEMCFKCFFNMVPFYMNEQAFLSQFIFPQWLSFLYQRFLIPLLFSFVFDDWYSSLPTFLKCLKNFLVESASSGSNIKKEYNFCNKIRHDADTSLIPSQLLYWSIKIHWNLNLLRQNVSITGPVELFCQMLGFCSGFMVFCRTLLWKYIDISSKILYTSVDDREHFSKTCNCGELEKKAG